MQLKYDVLNSKVNIYPLDALKYFQDSAFILKETRLELEKYLQPGITTLELDKIAEDFILKKKAIPLFKGYLSGNDTHPYPATLCISNNDVPVHGLPNNIALKKGDILSIDLGVKYNSFCSDSCRTYAIGEETHDIIEFAKKCFNAGFKKAYVGKTIGDIGFAINKEVILNKKYKTFNQFTGHGIGVSLHEEPTVSCIGFPRKGHPILEGMSICIEPVIISKTANIVQYDVDGIVQFKTDNGSVSAHYENQVFITKDGPINLTE